MSGSSDVAILSILGSIILSLFGSAIWYFIQERIEYPWSNYPACKGNWEITHSSGPFAGLKESLIIASQNGRKFKGELTTTAAGQPRPYRQAVKGEFVDSSHAKFAMKGQGGTAIGVGIITLRASHQEGRGITVYYGFVAEGNTETTPEGVVTHFALKKVA